MNRNTARVLRLLGLLETGRRIELSRRMRERRALPDVVILGAQKCGTSSLGSWPTFSRGNLPSKTK